MKKRDKNERPELPKLPYGEGSLSYVNSGGKIRILYQKVIGKLGKKRQKVYGDTVKECMDKMKLKEAEYIENEIIIPEYAFETDNTISLKDSMKIWLYEFKRTELSKDKSFDTVESTFNTHIHKSAMAQMPVANINQLVLKKFINDISKVKSLSTVKKVSSLLRQFFAYYYSSAPNKNPMIGVKPPADKKKLPMTKTDILNLDVDNDDIFQEGIIALSDEEIELLTMELTKPIEIGIGGYRHGYVILFLLWSFMRVGEALALMWKDIDFEEKCVKIYKAYTKIRNRDDDGTPLEGYSWILTPPKSRSSIRKLYLDERAIDCLLKYRETTKPKLLTDFIVVSSEGNPVSPQYFNHVLKTALTRCGIKKNISIHGLRHTGISYFIRHGVPVEVVSKMAGHSEISTTNEIYYDVIEEQKKNAFKNLDNKNNQ